MGITVEGMTSGLSFFIFDALSSSTEVPCLSGAVEDSAEEAGVGRSALGEVLDIGCSRAPMFCFSESEVSYAMPFIGMLLSPEGVWRSGSFISLSIFSMSVFSSEEEDPFDIFS